MRLRVPTRLPTVAALATMGILAPASGASAAVTPVDPATFAVPGARFSAPGLGFVEGGVVSGYDLGGNVAFGLGVATDPVPLVDPGVGQVVTVTGPVVLTTAPSLFVNSNSQVAAGESLTGVQAIP
jgi:hypothetical protein